MLKQYRKRPKGFSMAEVIVGSAIALGGIFATMTMLNYLWKALRAHKTYNMEVAAAQQLINNIRARPDGFYISPLPITLETSEPLSLANDQFAFSERFFGKVADCLDCPARLSYAIRPMIGARGNYEITVKIRYPSMDDPDNRDRDLKVKTYTSNVRR